VLDGPYGRLRPGRKRELVEDVRDVSLGGPLSDHKRVRDLAIREAAGSAGREDSASAGTYSIEPERPLH